VLSTTTCTKASAIILSTDVTVNGVSVHVMQWVQSLDYRVQEPRLQGSRGIVVQFSALTIVGFFLPLPTDRPKCLSSLLFST
jgi:hypothetical protein